MADILLNVLTPGDINFCLHVCTSAWLERSNYGKVACSSKQIPRSLLRFEPRLDLAQYGLPLCTLKVKVQPRLDHQNMYEPDALNLSAMLVHHIVKLTE